MTTSIKQNHKETLEIHWIPLLIKLALMSSGISLMLGFLLSCKEMISSTASSSFLWSMSIKFSCSLVPAMVPWKLWKPIGWLSLQCNQTWLFYSIDNRDQTTTNIISDNSIFLYYILTPFILTLVYDLVWGKMVDRKPIEQSFLPLFWSLGG